MHLVFDALHDLALFFQDLCNFPPNLLMLRIIMLM